MESGVVGRVAIVVRGDRNLRNDPALVVEYLGPIFEALGTLSVLAEPVVFGEEMFDEVRDQLFGVDGVLVWVDPVTAGQDRSRLDSLLREVASTGVWVSAHPDVILKIGTKEILYRTRRLGWGTDTHLYATFDAFTEQFPVRLASAGPRVLKQYRGNGGFGVWKVMRLDRANEGSAASDESLVRIQNGRLREQVIDELPLHEFMGRCEKYFGYNEGTGRLIDQAFQPRITEGAIRCYLSKQQVVGFSRQYAKGRAPHDDPDTAPVPDEVMGLPSDKTMFDPDEPEFLPLRSKVEGEWVPAMLELVDLSSEELPAIWDADFLFGPETEGGDDTYVLSEINVSAVLPFPDGALPRLAATTRDSVARAKARRSTASS